MYVRPNKIGNCTVPWFICISVSVTANTAYMRTSYFFADLLHRVFWFFLSIFIYLNRDRSVILGALLMSAC